MALDTPAAIAVLGAGPIGLEAALYARFLGYDVQVFERGRVCQHLRRCGPARLFAPWRLLGSPLGIAALQAQDPHWRPPDPDALLTAAELVERYYQPLAQSDLLADSVQEHCEAVAVGRETLLAHEQVGQPQRAEQAFRILVRGSTGERFAAADAVIDCTGRMGRPNGAGPGGVPALGERAAADQIQRGLLDLEGEDRERYAGRRVLVIGAGHAAATNVLNLAALEPRPAVTWVTRRAPEPAGPVRRVADDPLPQRDQLARAANALAAAPRGCVAHWPGTWVEAIDYQPAAATFRVRLVGAYAATIEVDRVVANVGHRPDAALSAELSVRLDNEDLVQEEPDYYVLGAKSRSRDARFAIADGLEQIRALFKIIGDRAGLDLYASIGQLPR